MAKELKVSSSLLTVGVSVLLSQGTATFSNYLNSFTGIDLISFSTICFHIGELLAKKKTPIAAIKGNRVLNCFISSVVAAEFARRKYKDFEPFGPFGICWLF